ncbi:hypothetical protein CYMTET_9166 [Cymbomonas tetramitiformis]|uniref:Uncharacterized protein n=1 Tax=Cymbomonas tetramitiformis TaxID=36881 RepID=A0AAE0GRM1_9CHLO|nr:hypothetical protein CYMTET_9166 [Cymbomonas tetramitiformis]
MTGSRISRASQHGGPIESAAGWERSSLATGNATVSNRNYGNCTAVFATWQSVDEYVSEQSASWGQMNDADFMKKAKILVDQFALVGVLKNIPTGGVGRDRIAMNLVVGGRVAMVNYWGATATEATSVYFVFAHRKNEHKVRLFPYADETRNGRPRPGESLGVESDYEIPSEQRHVVIAAIRVGLCLFGTVDATRHSVHRKVEDPESTASRRVDFIAGLKKRLSALHTLGNMEVSERA